ncbi:hypothetical protein [Haloarchaeobius amylolyticus]|uniref:hypothetical protein n=1 Tax=Haloarchaeobius amylolyticus TaxID=1198296 RepID=UPI0022722CAC|nr:hypothetical protein [Haloarchaeobius amylolyticus]
MLRFEVHGVYGGWEAAVTGPSDHVEFGVETDGSPVLHTYGSMHSLLRLYDLARLEQPRHPRFLGYDVHEGPNGITLDFQAARVETTYPELRDAMEPFLAEVFGRLDDQTVGDREAHIDTILDRDEVLVDLHDLRDQLG